MLGTTSTDAECLTSTRQRSSSLCTTDDSSARLDMHPIATKADPARLGLLDLPIELRLHIFELYCLPFDRGNTEPEPIRDENMFIYHVRPRSGELHYGGLLNPQLVCHQLRHEFMDAWTTCTTFDLPYQSIEWPWSRPREKPEDLVRDKTIGRLYFVLRDWLEEVPKDMRHRLRRLRLAFVTPIHTWSTGWRDPDCLLEMKGVMIARLMERLDVHPQLRIEVEVGVEKYCCGNHYWPYKEWMRFELKQRSPEQVREDGGDEWACVEEERRKTETRWNSETRYCQKQEIRESLATVV